MIVTIDGYAGSGKSTAARRLADALGFALLNTGAMYRAVGHILLRDGHAIYDDPPDLEKIAAAVEPLVFDMPGEQVFVNGEDLSPHVRAEVLRECAQERVGDAADGEHAASRQAEQRRLAAGRDIVCEGRDQGTAVFPDAPVKFFLRASVDVRAERRAKDLQAAGQLTDSGVIRRQIADRDRQDETRPIDPLAKAPDAIELDTSHLPADEVLRLMAEAVAKCRSRG